MPILDKDNAEEVYKYETFVKNSEYGRFSQDMAWEKVKNNWNSEYVYLEDDNGEIYAALSILFLKPLDNKAFFYANRGPVCDFSDVETVTKLIKEVEPLKEKHNAFLLRIDPEVPYNEELVNEYRKRNFTFRSRETEIYQFTQPRLNMLMDISSGDEEEILQGINKKTRYNIRLSGRKGIKVTWGRSDEYISTFYELTKIMAERQGINYRPKTYFERLIEYYPEIRIYIADYEGIPLSASVMVPYGNMMWYLYGASANEMRNKMPNYMMQWEGIKWGIEKGKKYYNFGGVFQLTNEDGLYRFKSGFCEKEGYTEWIGELDVVYNEETYRKFCSK